MLGNVEGASVASKILVEVDALLLMEVLVEDRINIFDFVRLRDVNLAIVDKLL